MIRLLITVLVSQGVQSFFLATSGPQASLLRGHVQGLWPGPDKYHFNSRLEYQAPGFQHFTDHQAFYEQGSSNLHPNILPPPPQREEPERQSENFEEQSIHPQMTPQLYQVPPQLPSREFSDVQPLYSSNLIQQGRMPFLSTYGLPPQMGMSPTVENLQQPGGGTTETTIPIVVKLDNNQAVVVPVKAVYTLPPFLESLVQRIQAYYSVYNPVESFHLDRPQVPSGLYEPIQQLPSNDVSQDLKEPTTTPVSTSPLLDVSSSTPTTTSSEPSTEQEATATSSEQSTPDSTLAPPSSSAPQSSSSEENSEEKSSESNEIASSTTTEAAQIETTTTPMPSSSSSSSSEAPPSPENVSTDLDSQGYTYNRPGRAFLFG